MSDLPDPQQLLEATSTETALQAADKKIVFGARKPTEEAAPLLTGIPLIIEAPFPFERTLQWSPAGSWHEEEVVEDAEKTLPGNEDVAPVGESENDSNHQPSQVLVNGGNTSVVVSQEVLIKVNEHVAQTLDREIGGFLLGNRYRCPNTHCDYVIIDQYSPAKFTESTEVRLAFTHEAWAQISDELSGKFLGKLLIGWYHSHPRLDVFLSSHDMEIQTERFAEPWNVALVLEPEKHHGGFFCARDGRINPNLPVDFFELLERNSRDSVIAWENYRASTSATPVLSTTNTATPTNNTSQELLEVRAKQNERTVTKGKRHGKLFWFAVLLLVLGSAALGVVNRKRIAGWWQQRMAGVSNAGVPAQPSPSAELSVQPSLQPSAEPSAQPSAEPSLEPSVAPSPSVEPSPTPEAAAQPTPVAQSTPAAAPTPKRTTRRSTAKPPAPKRRRK